MEIPKCFFLFGSVSKFPKLKYCTVLQWEREQLEKGETKNTPVPIVELGEI
jgi:hypothetical protein